MKKRAIVLLSGGLDSTVATLMAQKEYDIFLALTFNYGQKAFQRELAVTSKFCRRWQIQHKYLGLPWLAEISPSALNLSEKEIPRYQAKELDIDKVRGRQSAKEVWVPNRNALFINIAAGFAEVHQCPVIITGFNAEEAQTFPDNSLDFIERINATLECSTLFHPQVVSPIQELTKMQIVNTALQLDFRADEIWSCYEGGEKMCGCCESCVRTMRAFQQAGQWELISGYFAECGKR